MLAAASDGTRLRGVRDIEFPSRVAEDGYRPGLDALRGVGMIGGLTDGDRLAGLEAKVGCDLYVWERATGTERGLGIREAILGDCRVGGAERAAGADRGAGTLLGAALIRGE